MSVILTGIIMKASDLNIAELIQFAPGFVGLQGRRLIIHDLSSLGQFRRDLIETVGEEMARRILTRKGLFWGQADAAGMQRLFEWDTKEEHIKAAAALLKIIGMGYVEISGISLKESSGTISLEITCADSSEVEEYRNEFGKAKGPVCWVLAGYLSGYVSFCLGKSVYFTEKTCQAAEASHCSFIGKDIDSWGNDFDKQLTFFVAVDIQKRVQQLSERIREQQRVLALHRKQLQTAILPASLSGVEIRSKSFRNVLDLANKVASFDTTILVTGETGTGKEVLARHIHSQSPRKNFPFLAVNCSALPELLLENELFGHKAGAFTGATSNEAGLFEAAAKGTIFLDEVGDMSNAIQTKLLRVLQSKEIRPVGQTQSKQIDVRVISATNRDLDDLVQRGVFREDLLYRLRVLHIHIPPLRDRVDDILPLAHYFLEKLRRKLKINNLRFAPSAVDALIRYSWPGNVRELENSLEHAAILCTDAIITQDILPGSMNGRTPELQQKPNPQSLDDIESDSIRSTLELTGGNRAETARILRISESTLYRRLRKSGGNIANKEKM
jgi:DNA-binding NtrC family response regulator/predicted hydrocarbon binding protein